MAIKYYSIPSQGKTVAILRNTEMDVVNKIGKIMNGFDWCFCNEKYLMPQQFRAVVKVHGDDVFDAEEGMKLAKAKVMEKYHKAFDKRMDMFNQDVVELGKRASKSC